MAKSTALHDRADHLQLQQLVAALTDGVVLVEPDQTIAWANAAALRVHGVERVEELNHVQFDRHSSRERASHLRGR